MGRDKARVILGRRTLLEHVKTAAQKTGLKVSVIRKDCVSRCGPLGGILTRLRRTKAKAVLFLACDMPFVTLEFLNKFKPSEEAEIGTSLFTRSSSGWGFPLRLPGTAVDIVAAQIANGQFGIQNLAGAVSARAVRTRKRESRYLRNINSVADLREAESFSSKKKIKNKRAASIKKSLLS